MSTPQAGPAAEQALDPRSAQASIEYCFERGWSDGLPLVPCTESYLTSFLDEVDRDPDEVVLAMAHLNRSCTVRVAAMNAAMAGCRPEYFPVVLAAWDALREEGYAARGIWQSTTGCATMLVVNGPVRERIGVNSKGNVFGSGFRANATIGRAVRLTAINAFGLRPQVLDQATQGTPAKYTCCIAENEEDSPWAPLHADLGHSRDSSTVTAMMMRSCLHIEARHTAVPEQLLRDIVDTVTRTGALIHETISCCIVLSPEHAGMLAGHGWGKRQIQEFVHAEAVCSPEALDRVGKGSVSRHTRWRVPSDHLEAVPGRHDAAEGAAVRVLNSPEAVLVVVAGAANAGVSSVVETFGPRGGRPATARVHEGRSFRRPHWRSP
ncbi:MAG: hypothetical protein ACRDPK_13255 [Carbonactinosporaceae bacterium]